eukprot:CAMPEP_0172488966 /NCGR_PEP_ID=MMETSP1066-20121228/18696_1 /TAXON_ID=671091 /ORGANISM="Coscinodiscus wailesii, Strain CCMP2513" /LENGTH=362 /DNA_ID=CAMNT_0013256511 /DNA_START=6 /DNA_END=1091 /DNA_ORIENTATION=+
MSRNHTIYPLHPTKQPNPTRSLLKHSSAPPSAVDNALVIISSATIVGSVVWLPTAIYILYRRYKRSTDKKRRSLYGSILLLSIVTLISGPHRLRGVGKALRVRHWRLWRAWLNYVALEVITDVKKENLEPYLPPAAAGEGVMVAVAPHGIFPFALALAALPEAVREVFGSFRPIVATATAFFPFVRTFLSWLGAVDASRGAVSLALSEKQRLGLAPGGIAEMFTGYPKPRTHVNDECVLLSSRKGFIRMAVKHGVPVVPVYCFGSSQLLRRLPLPRFFEKLSQLLRVSLVMFFGRWGLPIPWRQKLLYVIGRVLVPPVVPAGTQEERDTVDNMHRQFCDEIERIFEKNKHAYGWGDKRLRFV